MATEVELVRIVSDPPAAEFRWKGWKTSSGTFRLNAVTLRTRIKNVKAHGGDASVEEAALERLAAGAPEAGE